MSKFDEIIKEKANNHEAPVPAAAWDNILKKEKKRRFGFFWWFAPLLLGGLFVIGYYQFSHTDKNNTIASIDKQPASAENINPGKPSTMNKEQVVPGKTVDASSAGNENIATINTQTAQANNKDISSNIPANNKNQITKNKPGKTFSDKEVSANKYNKEYIAGKEKDHTILKTISQQEDSKTTNHKQKTNNAPSFADKKNIVRKEKARSNINTQAGETEMTEADDSDKKKNQNEAVTNEPIVEDGLAKEYTNDKNINDIKSIIKKDLIVDSAEKKTATIPVENKKEKTAVNKPAKKHAWFIDLGFSPVLPIQQYDRSIAFNRSQVSANESTVFNGRLISTSIDPSVAFSLSLRRAFSKKFSIGLGLQYLQLKEQLTISGTEVNTKYKVVNRLVDNIGGPQLISDTIALITEGKREIKATNTYRFLSIPVFVQYNFIQRNTWSLGITGGINVNVYSEYLNEINEAAIVPLTTFSQSGNDNNNISFSFYGGLRLGKRIGKRMELFSTPSVTWTAGKQNIKNNLLNKKIQNLGLNIGLSYQLKK